MGHDHHGYDCGCHQENHDCKRNMYKTIRRECDLRSLTKAINEAGLREAVETLDPITVFGPTDCAFSKFEGGETCGDLDQILLYHVVNQKLYAGDLGNDKLYETLRDGDEPGSKLTIRANVYSKPTFKNVITINGAKVVEDNIKATNGVLHKINKVLCPPAGTLLELAINTPTLSILVAAVQAADPIVADVLGNAEISLTLFAPDNDAFARLASELGITLDELLEFLLAPENQQVLTEILLYHVLSDNIGTVFSAALRKRTENVPTALPEKTVDIKKKCGKILLRDELDRMAKVISKDNLATNGVAHIIDNVLLPFNPLA